MGLNKNDAFSPRHVQWVINMGTGNESSDDLSESFESISSEDSANSVETCSSTDTVEDDASSSSSSYGPLYELSELMAQLPIKRGLSKHYQGKSQSFGCLGSVVNLEDLSKKGNISYNKRMKSSKSFAGGLDDKKSSFGPKATITKKFSRRPNLSSVSDTNNSLVGNRRSPISLN